jgi:hypothetical protein
MTDRNIPTEVVPLVVDDERMGLAETGVFVRATLDGKWGSHDIAHLTRNSLLRWLRSRGGENLWAENTVMILLGWPQFQADEAVSALKDAT